MPYAATATINTLSLHDALPIFRMLGRQGIIPTEDAAAIETGLWQLMDEAVAGTLGLTLADEDVHMGVERRLRALIGDRKSTRLNSSHGYISYAVFCLKKKTTSS